MSTTIKKKRGTSSTVQQARCNKHTHTHTHTPSLPNLRRTNGRGVEAADPARVAGVAFGSKGEGGVAGLEAVGAMCLNAPKDRIVRARLTHTLLHLRHPPHARRRPSGGASGASGASGAIGIVVVTAVTFLESAVPKPARLLDNIVLPAVPLAAPRLARAPRIVVGQVLLPHGRATWYGRLSAVRVAAAADVLAVGAVVVSVVVAAVDADVAASVAPEARVDLEDELCDDEVFADHLGVVTVVGGRRGGVGALEWFADAAEVEVPEEEGEVEEGEEGG